MDNKKLSQSRRSSWCPTQRRLADTNECVFGCGGEAEDSIEHYCRCPVTLRVAGHMMHVSYPANLALDIWILNSSWLDVDEVLVGIGLLIYGCYMGFNSIVHGSVSSPEQAFRCIAQHCRQGAMGNDRCMDFLDRCWQTPVRHVC